MEIEALLMSAMICVACTIAVKGCVEEEKKSRELPGPWGRSKLLHRVSKIGAESGKKEEQEQRGSFNTFTITR